VVDACTQTPNSLPNMAELLPVARVAAHAWVGGERLLGAACFRVGDYAQALRHYQQVEVRNLLRPGDMSFQAIAHHQLGRTQQADRLLRDVRKWIRRADQERLPVTLVSVPAWDSWYEPQETRRRFQEAEAVLSKPSASRRE
jgi:hypothetical protein